MNFNAEHYRAELRGGSDPSNPPDELRTKQRSSSFRRRESTGDDKTTSQLKKDPTFALCDGGGGDVGLTCAFAPPGSERT